MLGVVLPCWYFGQYSVITPLVLGVIAAALAETDDNFWGRLKALLLTFGCFALASFSIEILFLYPILFALGLFVSTFGFIMLGAIGARYASIAFGSLLIAIYTMLGADLSPNIWYQPALLLTGAAWYYLLSLIWQSFVPLQAMQNSLADTFATLAIYIDSKSQLFHPVQRLNPQPLRIEAAKLNANTVAALERCRQTLLKRSNRGHLEGTYGRYLHIYFVVQDIHERLSSSHYRYQELSDHFERSDVLFRFKYLLQNYANEFRSISQALQLGVEYSRNPDTSIALDELYVSIEALQKQKNPVWKESLNQLLFLFNNLRTVDKLLNNIDKPESMPAESYLDDRSAHTIKQMWHNIHSSLRVKSQLFRHAVRMSVALTAGYGVIHIFDIEHGYWILLTTLFVCQPNFSATKQKLLHRIGGTFLGLIVGVLLLGLIPEVEGQLFAIVVSSVLFFAFRIQNYAYATTFITILVLFLFSQLGIGYAVILPRLFDTLVGSCLAVAAVYFILPDWQAKKIPQFMAEAIQANKEYLGQIIVQYRLGKNDDLAYRIARRSAHNSDAQLSVAVSSMLAEPDKHQGSSDLSFRVITLNHALLSYISALGAHRTKLNDITTHKLVIDAYQSIHVKLEAIEQVLHNETNTETEFEENQIRQRLSQWREDDGYSAQMILQQLELIHRMLPELKVLAKELSTIQIKT